MQYFTALKIGQKRVKESREYLNKITNGKAMPALALRNKLNTWEPVGEKNFYSVVNESSGYVLSTGGCIITICDKNGISKTLIQGVTREQKDYLIKIFNNDNIPEFTGKVQLPV